MRPAGRPGLRHEALARVADAVAAVGVRLEADDSPALALAALTAAMRADALLEGLAVGVQIGFGARAV